jgi:MerR family transcriptional regulator, copper efflux regulator
MYIGKVSKLTGATPKAIRHYEAIGLIPPPQRLGKYRYYSEKDVEVIRCIKHAQKYGFKLSELKSVVAKIGSGEATTYRELIDIIDKKRNKLRQEMEQLIVLDKGLVELRRLLQDQKCSC